jgi:NADH-quinone oxidoreductase subunit C
MASKPPPADDVAALRERFSEAITDVRESFGEVTCYVEPNFIVEVCRYLRDDPRFAMNMLADLCGADLGIDQEPRFEVIYHLNSLTKLHRLRLKVQLPADEPSIATMTPIWKTANWLERETFDMFGIVFDGHPDLRRILMPEEFQWHPLRKDYPVRGYDDF